MKMFIKVNCTNFKVVFCHKDLSDVDTNDIFHEFNVLQMSKSTVLMLAFEIVEFLKAANC